MQKPPSGFGNLSTGDGRLDAPTFHRNKDPILATFAKVLPVSNGDVIETGSGTGQHAVAFAARFPHLNWWPTDPIAEHRQSIDAHRRHAALNNLMPAGDLDIEMADWGLGQHGRPPGPCLAGLVAINVIHIAPWSVSLGLFAAAAKYLSDDGILLLYGPFSEGGRHNAESNKAFDLSLRARDPRWGVRDLDAVRDALTGTGLMLKHIVPQPANNRVLGIVRS